MTTEGRWIVDVMSGGPNVKYFILEEWLKNQSEKLLLVAMEGKSFA